MELIPLLQASNFTRSDRSRPVQRKSISARTPPFQVLSKQLLISRINCTLTGYPTSNSTVLDPDTS